MVYYLLQSSERKKKRKENKIHKSESNLTIAVSHVALCPNKRLIWLEGIRVHPAYRRSKVATHLIEKCFYMDRIHDKGDTFLLRSPPYDRGS